MALVLAFSSCVVEDEMPTPEEPEYSNSIEPKDNQLILSETTIGNSTDFSGLYFSEKSNSGNFYVVGDLNGSQASTNLNVGGNDFEQYYEPILIKFDISGNKVWEKRPGFTIQRMKVIPSGILSNKEMIVLTGYDDNEVVFQDESPDRSRIMLFDEDGNFIDNYSRDFFLSLFDVKIVENNSNFIRFVGVGSVYKSSLDNNYYPGFYEFKIKKNPIEIDTNSIITNQLLDEKWRHVRFWNLELSNDNYIVSGAEYEDSEYNTTHILKFSPSDYDNPIWWSKLSNNNNLIYHWRGGLEVDNQKAYICGYFEDTNKGTAGGCNNCYWVSAYATGIDLNSGDFTWNKSFSGSELSDRLFKIKSDGTNVYAGGTMSRSWCTGCSDEFTIGNGWVLKLNASNGEEISQRTFGNVQYRTRFKTMVLDNSNLWCIGQRQITNSKSKGLLIKLNKGSL